MRNLLILLAIALSLQVSCQGLLRSKIIQGDSAKRCTLIVRSVDNWDKPVTHVFRVSTTTYLLPGDYVVHYWMDTTWLHGEFIHVSRKFTVLEKVIFEKRQPLGSVTFIWPKKIGIEKYLEY